MTFIRYVVIAACLGVLSGCSSQGRGVAPPELTVLQEVNDLLHSVASAAGKPAAKLADMDRYQSMYPRAYAAVKSGGVVVIWGAALKGEEQVGEDEAAVAYEKSVPTDGGYVLLSAGTVKKLTAAEFQGAPKAKP